MSDIDERVERTAAKMPLVVVADIATRLAVAEVGSCTCETKTPEIKYHSVSCPYRLFAEARTEIENARSVYLSAVQGRRDFRSALKTARADLAKAVEERDALRVAGLSIVHAYRKKYERPSTGGVRSDAPLRAEMAQFNAALSGGSAK